MVKCTLAATVLLEYHLFRSPQSTGITMDYFLSTKTQEALDLSHLDFLDLRFQTREQSVLLTKVTSKLLQSMVQVVL